MYSFKKGMYWVEAELCIKGNESKHTAIQLMENKRVDKVDRHICPLCKKPQTKLLDTWLCSTCNNIALWDLVYDYKEYRRLGNKAESR
jgi:hypothetical protein